jgi:hypothetical protein
MFICVLLLSKLCVCVVLLCSSSKLMDDCLYCVCFYSLLITLTLSNNAVLIVLWILICLLSVLTVDPL